MPRCTVPHPGDRLPSAGNGKGPAAVGDRPLRSGGYAVVDSRTIAQLTGGRRSES